MSCKGPTNESKMPPRQEVRRIEIGCLGGANVGEINC